MNQLSLVKSDVLVGNALLVMNHESLVKSDVLVGNELLVMNQLSFVKSDVLVGNEAEVINQASLVNSDILSLGCNAVAQALAQFLIAVKSLIASCFQLQVFFSAVVTNLLLPSVISSVVSTVLLK
jgi:hypothetical protein